MKTVLVQRNNSRAVAAGIIGEWLEEGVFPDHLVETVEADHAFVMEMVYGVVRWKRALEWVVKRCANRSVDRKVMPFLFVGIYQLLLMDNVEEYAAVNETVEAVKSARMQYSSNFVNAMLRTVARERESISGDLAKQRVVVRESHPDVLVERWEKQFGKEKMLELLAWNNSRPEVVIRVNSVKKSFVEYIGMLEKAGIKATAHAFAPQECLLVPRGVLVKDLPGYADGFFSVQDPSTLLAVNMLNPQPGEFVLDACAAPGGKTCAIADKMAGQGRIVAMDIDEDRLDTLRENIDRFGAKSVAVCRGDASSAEDVKTASDGKLFDKILLDVPCTNTGVLRRRPDARWRFSIKGLSERVDLQRRILANVSKYLKPGGVLVYSTCSLEFEEDDGIIGWWLSLNPDFEQIGSEQLFPPDSRTDGAYACALRRAL